jgi:hypothetical protein
MRITASVRPQGLKRGVRTESFYRHIGLKDSPDVRDVVGTLTLSATKGDELQFLAALNKFWRGEGKCSVVIAINGEEYARMDRGADADNCQG